MKQGAADYLLKDCMARLGPAGADFFFDKSTELDQVAEALGQVARRGAANQG